MTAIAKTSDVKKLGRILGVWAHPDDETWTCAGIMAIACVNKQAVMCITATKGEAGVQDEKRWPADQLGEIRRKELEKALTLLGDGNINHQWLEYKDGKCKEAPSTDAVKRITSIINEFRPNTILTFGPEGLTGHPDHATVSKWVSEAVKKTSIKPTVYHVCESPERYEKVGKKLDQKYDIYFNIDKPPLCEECDLDICLKLEENILDKKIKALKVQESQTSKIFIDKSQQDLLIMAEKECFCLAK